MEFVEVLKQPRSIKSNKLDPDYIYPTEELDTAIPGFFSPRPANVHAVIVCSDCRNEPISERAFQEALCRENAPCIVLPNDTPTEGPCHYYTYSTETLDSVGSAIIRILDQAHLCYGDKNDADSLSGQIAGEENDNKDWKSIWTQQLARMLSREIKMTVDSVRIRGSKLMHTLFLLLCLPESFFEVFRESKFFPSYVEYVVKGVDASNRHEIEQAILRYFEHNKKKELDQIGTASTNSTVAAEKMEDEIASSFGKDDIQNLARIIEQFASFVDSFSNIKINDYVWNLLLENRNLLYSVLSGTIIDDDTQQYERNGRVLKKSQHPPTTRE